MADIVHPTELSLFEQPVQSKGISRVQYVNYRPVGQVNDDSVIEFNIPGCGSQYLNLKDTRMHMKLQITKPNGVAIDATDKVGPLATPLQAMFSQVDILLQQENVTPSCNLYPFKAYTEKLLTQSSNYNHPQSQAELYILDGNSVFGKSNNLANPDPYDDNAARQNKGLNQRAQYTSQGRVIDLDGPLHSDIAQQERLILNSVDVRVRLYPTLNAFRLMTNSDIKYQVKIVDIYLRVCKVVVSPEVILAHDKVLQLKPAIYPFWKTTMKTFTLPAGAFQANIEDPFSGTIPSKLYVFFVSAEAFNGSYKKNAFEYKNYALKTAGFYVNGLSVPNQPLETDFAHRDMITAYQALVATSGHSDPNTEFDITPSRFIDGFTILGFNLEASMLNTLDYLVKPRNAHSRLELRFGTATPEVINIMLLAVQPSALYIDRMRNVSTSAE